jgi:hypothetical protein
MLIETDELIDPATIAAELRVKHQTLTAWRTLGRGPAFVKVGSKVFYRRADISEWLGSRHRQPRSREAAAHA